MMIPRWAIAVLHFEQTAVDTVPCQGSAVLGAIHNLPNRRNKTPVGVAPTGVLLSNLSSAYVAGVAYA